MQRGMNYRINANYSVILMNRKDNAPYSDSYENDGQILIYQGHDQPESKKDFYSKFKNQTIFNSSGNLNENGKFYKAAMDYKRKLRHPEHVKVYEKLFKGVWLYTGMYLLVDTWFESNEFRFVYKFKLKYYGEKYMSHRHIPKLGNNVRFIPSDVKLEVWKRDKGRCVICGATDELHFDHVIPFCKGGSSLTAANIQLLCARHNLQKSDEIS